MFACILQLRYDLFHNIIDDLSYNEEVSVANIRKYVKKIMFFLLPKLCDINGIKLNFKLTIRLL